MSRFNFSENLVAGAGLLQDKLERLPGFRKSGDFLREQFEKQRERNRKVEETQKMLMKNFAESVYGRELTDEEVDKLPSIDPSGFLSAGPAVKAAGKITKMSTIKEVGNFIKAVETRLRELGGAGEELIGKITRAADVGEVRAGKRLSEIRSAGLPKLSREERFNLLDVLEGRAKPINDNVVRASQSSRSVLDEIAGEAQSIGVKSRLKTTLDPKEFQVIPKELQPIAKEIRSGKFKSAEEFVNSQTKSISDKATKEYTGFKKYDYEQTSLPIEKIKQRETPDLTSDKFKEIKKAVSRGDRTPIIVDESNFILDGHHRFNAYKESGANYGQVPVLKVVGKGNGRITKSQLTDLYNQFTKGVKELPTGLTPFQREQLQRGNKVFATLERPFTPRKDFFPHVIPEARLLKSGKVREDVIENIVRQGIRKDAKEAGKFIDDYVGFLESGEKRQSLLDYMVETGQAKNEAEALANLQRFRKRTIKRQGSLEFARQVDLPFYDPDPARVLPQSIAGQSKRLAEISEFGQKNQDINKLINRIRKDNGDVDADFAREAVDRILNIANAQQTQAAKVSSFLRTLQGFKLGMASIPNMTQGFLNTLLASDLRAVAAGFKGILTRQGRELGVKSGATLESTINEALEAAGSSRKALGKFLRATGFSASERLNRIFAANAGQDIIKRQVQVLQRNPDNKFARRWIKDLGLDVDRVLKEGIDSDDILMAAKKFSDMTQFRSRPQDLPFFASSPAGKIFFQFKNFIYGQSRLLHRAIVRELKDGNIGRATRNLIVLGSVFPLTGEVIADVRSLLTGRKRKTKGIQRYLDNISQTGAMGIFFEALYNSRYGGAEFIAGPTVSEAGEIFEALGEPITTGRFRKLGRYTLGRIPLVGQLTRARVFKPRGQKKETSGNRFNF